MKPFLLNICVYQAVWILCVFLGNIGALISLPFIVLHLFLLPYRREDLLMMTLLLPVGISSDGLLQFSGVITFSGAGFIIPVWLMGIWLALALLPNHSLKWMKGSPLTAAAFGALGGPLAYWAGVKAGAADFSLPLLPSLLLFSVIWALIWPVVMQIANRLLPAYTDSDNNHRATTGGVHDQPSR